MSKFCSPLNSLEEVDAFTKEENTWYKVYPLQPRTHDHLPGNLITCNATAKCHENFQNRSPRTIVCHDMKGGYLEDKYVHGSHKWDEYRFFHWAGIDAFVYFSHHFVTIPPIGWVNAGHLHGVKVLGTVITELQEGENIWNSLLVDDQDNLRLNKFIDSLVNICIYYGFDGYLLNVENTIIKDKVHKLIYFVEALNTRLMNHLPNKLIIWYDSVTTEGELNWQNELNSLNKAYFDVCDGIYLNYAWTEKTLENSAELAQNRLCDVYVGVDVFGRGCFGGGGFNSCEAVAVARKYGLSVAIFAPGWTYENLGSKNFAIHEYIFWQKLWKYLFIHGPTTLPFTTSFCQGFGRKKYNRGFVSSSNCWFDLCEQQHQPSVCSCISDECIQTMFSNTKTSNNKQLTSENDSGEMDIESVDNSAVQNNRHIVENEITGMTDKNKTVGKESEGITQTQTSICNSNSLVTNYDMGSGEIYTKENLPDDDVMIFKEETVYDDTKSSDIKSDGFEMPSCTIDAMEKLSIDITCKLRHVNETFKNMSIGQYEKVESMHTESNIVSNNEADFVETTSAISENMESNTGSLSHISGCLQIYNDDSFVGGGCLKISKHLSSNRIPLPISFHRILRCGFVVEQATLVTVVTKNISEDSTYLDLIVAYKAKNSTEYREKVLLDIDPLNKSIDVNEEETMMLPRKINLLLKRGLTAKKMSTTEIQIPEREGWKVRYYVLDIPPEHVIFDISTKLYGFGNSVLLGLLSLSSVYFRY